MRVKVVEEAGGLTYRTLFFNPSPLYNCKLCSFGYQRFRFLNKQVRKRDFYFRDLKTQRVTSLQTDFAETFFSEFFFSRKNFYAQTRRPSLGLTFKILIRKRFTIFWVKITKFQIDIKIFQILWIIGNFLRVEARSKPFYFQDRCRIDADTTWNTLNLNDVIFNRFLVYLEIQFQTRSMSDLCRSMSASFQHWFQPLHYPSMSNFIFEIISNKVS